MYIIIQYLSITFSLSESLSYHLFTNHFHWQEDGDHIMKTGDRLISYGNFSGIRNVIFEMTNTCNMHCIYCFERDAQIQRKPEKISWEAIQHAIDSVFTEENELYMVTFFGGEPLLNKEFIFKAITYAKAIARKHKSLVSFNMVTNATCLDLETILHLNAEDVYLFVSFDGDQDSQDKYRRMLDGTSSYEKILENLKLLICNRKNMYCRDNMAVRMTITKDGIEHLVDRYQFLCQLGVDKVTFALVSADTSKPYAISTEDIPALRKAYLNLAQLFIEEIESGKLCNRFFQSLVKKIVDGTHYNHFCDCGNRYLAIGIDGNIYPCEGFLGLKDFSVGNILKNSTNYGNYHIDCVNNNAACSKCWARYLCGGGCYHEWWMRTGNINAKDQVVCETYRIAVETALHIYAELKQKGLLSTFLSLSEEALPDNSIPVLRQFDCIQLGSMLYSVTEESSYFIDLDEISTTIVSLCDGKHTVSEITNILLNTYKCEPSDLYKDICHLLNNLYDHKAIYFTNTV